MTTNENLGPAEQIIRSLTEHVDHVFHNRPGVVRADGRTNIGVRWEPIVTSKNPETGATDVFVMEHQTRRRVGHLQGSEVVGYGRLQKPGLFPEAAAFMYRRVAEVWALNNDIVAHWASWAYTQDHKDLKIVLAAFLLAQSDRVGAPVMDDGKVDFYDEDYRAVGEAMALIYNRTQSLSPQQIIRLFDVLECPLIAEINRSLGFGRSQREPHLGRLKALAQRWLRQRELNPQLLAGLVRAGQRTTVMRIAQRSGYKAATPAFYAALRWRQTQTAGGHRRIGIGAEVAAAETLKGRTETQVCEFIVNRRPGFKRLFGLLSGAGIGLTRAIMAACCETQGVLSDADVLQLLPTIEALGVQDHASVRRRMDAAAAAAVNLRAGNIARKLKTDTGKAVAAAAQDAAAAKAMTAATRGMTVCVGIDVSGSMEASIELAKGMLNKFLGGFPRENVHVCAFNTVASAVVLRSTSASAVETALRGIRAGGGTDYASAVRLWRDTVKVPADHDCLFLFVGDEEDAALNFAATVRGSGLNPMGFLLLRTPNAHGSGVRNTASALGVPCAQIGTDTFDDPYAVTRTIRRLIESTPVNHAAEQPRARVSLIDQIMATPILVRPVVTL